MDQATTAGMKMSTSGVSPRTRASWISNGDRAGSPQIRSAAPGRDFLPGVDGGLGLRPDRREDRVAGSGNRQNIDALGLALRNIHLEAEDETISLRLRFEVRVQGVSGRRIDAPS